MGCVESKEKEKSHRYSFKNNDFPDPYLFIIQRYEKLYATYERTKKELQFANDKLSDYENCTCHLRI